MLQLSSAPTNNAAPAPANNPRRPIEVPMQCFPLL
jgi:hypothetical protein